MLLTIILTSALVLLIAYKTYGNLLARLLRLDPNRKTPAVELADGVDYDPIDWKFLMSQHFSAIAAAGPIVGPIVAGMMFGWLPTLIWILLGAIFIGGIHDFGSLVASIRHKARSIAEVVREHMTRRSYLLFLTFVWIALIYIIVAFTDIVAGSFVGNITLESGQQVSGAGIATSSLLYLALPIVMAFVLRWTKLSLLTTTLIFLPLVGAAIWFGQYLPLDLASWFGVSDLIAQKLWIVALLIYCFIAAIAPMWILLQPRGHLGGFFLFAALIAGAVGVLLSGSEIQYPAFIGWNVPAGAGTSSLFPILFITVACGACSGFHSIIASGTSSKQLRTEPDAKKVGYGAMLLEAMVAVVSLSCVMILSKEAIADLGGKPNFIYALGLGRFMEVLGIPASFGVLFGLMAFTTFVYDTLDVCTRLGRYILQELFGWQGNLGRYFATALTAFIPLIFVLQTTTDAAGNVIPGWRVFWPLFGASNQLLAAIGLLGITVWLHRTYRAKWVWPIAGIPTIIMYVMSGWALLQYVSRGFVTPDGLALPTNFVPWVALVLIVLAVLLLWEAVKVFSRSKATAGAAGNPPAVAG
ncbi:MAG: carbon starvation protein A [bacterium]|nr:carbon starvation protein A [bacterium]